MLFCLPALYTKLDGGQCLKHVGTDPPALSLKDYDHRRWGPFLGVSDGGTAAGVIRDAALQSTKVRALGACPPIVLGVALDAERLGAVGETPVGPPELAKIRLESMGRILTTTNVGTQVGRSSNRPERE
jgi:hypothetical protein